MLAARGHTARTMARGKRRLDGHRAAVRHFPLEGVRVFPTHGPSGGNCPMARPGSDLATSTNLLTVNRVPFWLPSETGLCFGRLSIVPGEICFDPKGVWNRTNAHPINVFVHRRTDVALVEGRWIPPIFHSSGLVLVEERGASVGVANLTRCQRRKVTEALGAGGIEVTICSTRFSTGISIGSVTSLERLLREHGVSMSPSLVNGERPVQPCAPAPTDPPLTVKSHEYGEPGGSLP